MFDMPKFLNGVTAHVSLSLLFFKFVMFLNFLYNIMFSSSSSTNAIFVLINSAHFSVYRSVVDSNDLY